MRVTQPFDGRIHLLSASGHCTHHRHRHSRGAASSEFRARGSVTRQRRRRPPSPLVSSIPHGPQVGRLRLWGFRAGGLSADEVVVFRSVGRELQRAGTDVLWTGAADGRLVISQCSVVTCSIELARVGGLWFRSLLNFHGTVRKSQVFPTRTNTAASPRPISTRPD